ncbi:unnamed protein product [Caenorhabditis nigoni]
MAPTLVDMPELVMNRILDELDYKSIQALRKVCHDIRNFIDDQNPNTKINHILIECDKKYADYRILYDNNGPELNSKTLTSVYYEKYRNGCLVRYKKEEIVLENEEFLNRSMADLETIVRSKNTTVRFLRLVQKLLKYGRVEPKRFLRCRQHWDFSLILDALKEKVLEPRTHKLKVHSLMIETNDQKEIMKILPFLDSEFLKKLCIFKNKKEDVNKVLEMDEILELDHFNDFERLEISECIIPDRFATRFAHLPYCYIHVETICSNDLLFLKESLLHSPSLQKYSIGYQKFPDDEHFVRANGTWYTEFVIEKFHKRSYFRMKDADSILMITYTNFEKRIIFEKTTRRQIEDSWTTKDWIVIQ